MNWITRKSARKYELHDWQKAGHKTGFQKNATSAFLLWDILNVVHVL